MRPTSKLTIEIHSKRHDRNAQYSTIATISIAATPALPALAITLSSSSCSIASVPVRRIVTGWSYSCAIDAASSRILSIGARAGRMRVKSNTG